MLNLSHTNYTANKLAMTSVLTEQVFLTQPDQYRVGPSPSEIDVPTLVASTIIGTNTTTTNMTVTGGFSAPGLITNATSVGGGQSVIAGVVSETLELKSLTSVGGTLNVTSTGTTVNFDLANTYLTGTANVGTGTGLAAATAGSVADFKTLTSNASTIAITSTATTVNLDLGYLAAQTDVSYQQTQTVGNNTVNTILANNLTGSNPALTTPTVSNFVTGTGIYTTPNFAAMFTIGAFAQFTGSIVAGDNPALQVIVNGALAGWSVFQTTTGASAFYATLNVPLYCAASSTIQFQIQNPDTSSHSFVVNVGISMLHK